MNQCDTLHEHVAHFNIIHIEAVIKWNSLVVLTFILVKHIFCSQNILSFKIQIPSDCTCLLWCFNV